MWLWAAFFLFIVPVAGALGLEGIPAPWADIAKTVALVAFVVFLAAVITSLVAQRRPPGK
jgi:uncharacterized membrane protein YtjA (UPF0391 family)